jgi:hypothetical protein
MRSGNGILEGLGNGFFRNCPCGGFREVLVAPWGLFFFTFYPERRVIK